MLQVQLAVLALKPTRAVGVERGDFAAGTLVPTMAASRPDGFLQSVLNVFIVFAMGLLGYG